MAAHSTAEVYDLLILVDATSSMSNYLAALRQSLPQVISISALTNCFERIGLLAYRDYCDKDLTGFSGWMSSSSMALDHAQPNLVETARKLAAIGGGDPPEAIKTALSESYKLMRSDATTLMLLYTDAAPHMSWEDTGYSHAAAELKALNDPRKHGCHGKLFADWASVAHTLKTGEKRARVISILEDNFGSRATGYYEFLSTVTGGPTVL